MRAVKNHKRAVTDSKFDIGDIVVAVGDGVDVRRVEEGEERRIVWDYRAGDVGTVENYVEGQGYHIRVGQKLYPGVFQGSWERRL